MRSFIEQIKRFFYWGWTLRKSFDFDYGYTEQLLLLKLKRLLHTMNTDPYHMNLEDLYKYKDDPNNTQFDKDWAISAIKGHRALICVIKLLERRLNDSYYWDFVGITAYYEQNPINFDSFNERTEEDRLRYINILKPMLDAERRLIDRDKKLIYNILYKYSDHWWT